MVDRSVHTTADSWRSSFPGNNAQTDHNSNSTPATCSNKLFSTFVRRRQMRWCMAEAGETCGLRTFSGQLPSTNGYELQVRKVCWIYDVQYSSSHVSRYNERWLSVTLTVGPLVYRSAMSTEHWLWLNSLAEPSVAPAASARRHWLKAWWRHAPNFQPMAHMRSLGVSTQHY